MMLGAAVAVLVAVAAVVGSTVAVEKVVASKLLKPGANKRIATVDSHAGVVRLDALHACNGVNDCG